MSDRLTQLQICLDQLIDQFKATVNYVNVHSQPALLDEDPTSVSNLAAKAPLPQQQQQQQQSPQATQQQSPEEAAPPPQETPEVDPEIEFSNTIEELSTDIVLKSRQINMLIDSLPGIGVTPEEQLRQIDELSWELKAVEEKRKNKIHEKDQLLKVVDELIEDLVTGISRTRMQ
ncbi:uncharacterized protein LODBEIA_P19150 [Lodderomyces beijingensis]|uniref:Mediator of RNA polymerase II transcription subunit 21 n=1 Tax=Lodderomyces beijingensis TaxID=1775926 RepID=A0ABP0ZHR6_9ASCO